jgi:hypothetical protein
MRIITEHSHRYYFVPSYIFETMDRSLCRFDNCEVNENCSHCFFVRFPTSSFAGSCPIPLNSDSFIAPSSKVLVGDHQPLVTKKGNIIKLLVPKLLLSSLTVYWHHFSHIYSFVLHSLLSLSTPHSSFVDR